MKGYFPVQVTLVPFAGVLPQDLADLIADLRRLGFAAKIGRTLTLPPEAYQPDRRQYHAEGLLALLRPQPGQRVLGITNSDLYAGNLNFVFGMADVAGRTAVISVCRLREAADDAIYRERVAKEAVHELGHTLGLPHCANPKCVMHFSNSLHDTDIKGMTFCPTCHERAMLQFNMNRA